MDKGHTLQDIENPDAFPFPAPLKIITCTYRHLQSIWKSSPQIKTSAEEERHYINTSAYFFIKLKPFEAMRLFKTESV